MEELLSKIYDKVAYYEHDSIILCKEYDCVVEEMLEPLKDKKTKAEVEEIRELIYKVSYHAQKNGFYIGVRFVFKCVTELCAIGNTEISK